MALAAALWAMLAARVSIAGVQTAMATAAVMAALWQGQGIPAIAGAGIGLMTCMPGMSALPAWLCLAVFGALWLGAKHLGFEKKRVTLSALAGFSQMLQAIAQGSMAWQGLLVHIISAIIAITGGWILIEAQKGMASAIKGRAQPLQVLPMGLALVMAVAGLSGLGVRFFPLQHIVATFCVLMAGGLWGAGGGGGVALALGAAMLLGGSGYIAAWTLGLAGVLAGISRGAGKIWQSAIFVVVASICPAALGETGIALLAGLAGCVGYVLLGGRLSRMIAIGGEEEAADSLQDAAQACARLLEETAWIYQGPRAARDKAMAEAMCAKIEASCAGCALQRACWDGGQMREVLMDALVRGETQVLPAAAHRRCLHPAQLLSAMAAAQGSAQALIQQRTQSEAACRQADRQLQSV
nr:hypothetical protein [bacterium]